VFRNLQRVIGGWQPLESRRCEKPTLAIKGTAATVAAWKKEEDDYQKLPEVVKEQEGRTCIINALNVVIEILKSIESRIELRIIGRQAKISRKKKRNSAAEVDTILTEHFLAQSCFIEYLFEGIENGERAAYQLAKKLFSMNALVHKLSLSKGSISKSKVYKALQEKLRMTEKADQFQRIGHDIALGRAAMKDHLTLEELDLIKRIESCGGDGKVLPELAHALANMIRDQAVPLDEAEDRIARAERGGDLI
jgi:hypothetical protein